MNWNEFTLILILISVIDFNRYIWQFDVLFLYINYVCNKWVAINYSLIITDQKKNWKQRISPMIELILIENLNNVFFFFFIPYFLFEKYIKLTENSIVNGATSLHNRFIASVVAKSKAINSISSPLRAACDMQMRDALWRSAGWVAIKTLVLNDLQKEVYWLACKIQSARWKYRILVLIVISNIATWTSFWINKFLFRYINFSHRIVWV